MFSTPRGSTLLDSSRRRAAHRNVSLGDLSSLRITARCPAPRRCAPRRNATFLLSIYQRCAPRRYAPLRIASPRNATFLFVNLSALRLALPRFAPLCTAPQLFAAQHGATPRNVSFVNLPALRSAPHRVAALCSAKQRNDRIKYEMHNGA